MNRIRKHLWKALVVFSITCVSASAWAQGLEGKSGVTTIVLNDDIQENRIKFVSEAPAEKIVGTAEDVEGSVTIDLSDLSKAQGKISFPVEKMNTGNNMRDRHMRGKEWLNAKKNPNITFELKGLKSIKVSKKAGGKQKVKAKAMGTVTVNGVPKDTLADVTITWMDAKPNAKIKGDLVKVETKFDVALADHEVEGKRGVVGDKVGKTIAIDGILYAHAKE